jgi:cytochrome c oxidase subunit 3
MTATTAFPPAERPRPPSAPAYDVADLPTYDFGPKSPIWWGTLAFCAIEGMGFALAMASYLFLAFMAKAFPVSSVPPGLLWSSLLTLVLVASALPNLWLDRRAHAHDLGGVRAGLLVMTGIGVLLLVLRAFEFTTLNVSWDEDAYGSILWLLLGLHTTHLATDFADTAVLTALMFTRHGHGKRFSDVADNCFYWNFVILSWLPIEFLIYWSPRI